MAYSFYIFIYFMICMLVSYDCSNVCSGSSADGREDPATRYMLIHTLGGETILVERLTGKVIWSRQLGPVLLASYDDGPVIITDPLEGNLYEYSDESSTDILRGLDYSIMGYIRRSPAYYKQFLSFGSKSDFWLSVDVNTGQLFQSASQDFVLQCPGHLNSSDTMTDESQTHVHDVIGIGRTQYNLLFRDPVTGVAKLNITYSTLAIHSDPDVQTLGLRHIATTQPELLTFEGSKLLWHLPLSTPVVGLYAVWRPPRSQLTSQTHRSADDVPLSKTNIHFTPNNNRIFGIKSTTPTRESVPSRSVQLCSEGNADSSLPLMPRILRRIAFTTYALDIPQELESHSTLSSANALVEHLESKFNGSLELVPSLFVGSSTAAPLYAIVCVAEASLKLRGIRRASELFMIEGPDALPGHIPADQENLRWLVAGLVGLYELPTPVPKSWPWDYQPLNPQFPQIAGPNFETPGLISTDYSDFPERTNGKNDRVVSYYIQPFLVGLITVFCIVCTTYVIRRARQVSPRKSENGTASVLEFSFLPSHFDTPDSNGWAGCTALEAGQPEAIRINLHEVLGHGANGTMVFSGMFGSHRTAVKRIVRQPQLEKHWRREHAILLHHQHPHLVRCYWTGSTANFHYLVMERCETTLSDLLRDSPRQGFEQWGLTPCGIIHQVLQAVVCLHQNNIVHRDLKPSNVLVARDETRGNTRVVVGDFGLSRPLPMGRTDWTNSFGPHLISGTRRSNEVLRTKPYLLGSSVDYVSGVNLGSPSLLDPVSDMTSVGVTFGTLGWMAPELCDPQAGQLSYSIDIFACGLLAYHILTGGGHPYDSSGLPDSEQPSLKADSGSSGSGLPSASLSGDGQTSRPNSDSGDGTQAPFCYSTATRLNRHHARQLAIAENRTPSLSRLTESDSLVDVAKGFLGRHLIQTMLSHNPHERPSAEEALHHPMFWPPSKTMRFLSELSDVLDTREGDSAPSNDPPLTNVTSCASDTPTSNRFFAERRSLLEAMDSYAPWVFNEHWFYRLEPELVQDLLRTRGYQDTSLMDLLRAIRNKHNHLWHLHEHVRVLLGSTQEGMAAFWTSRFPALVPLLYTLSRQYLTGFSGLAEFLPPQRPRLSTNSGEPQVVVQDWWRSAYPLIPQFPAPELYGCLDGSFKETPTHYGLQAYVSYPARRAYCVKPWKRGQVVPPASASNTPPSRMTLKELDQCNESELNASTDTIVTTNAVDQEEANVDQSKMVESEEFITKRPRRRPNQTKKIRPPKKESKCARERQKLISRAGCELISSDQPEKRES